MMTVIDETETTPAETATGNASASDHGAGAGTAAANRAVRSPSVAGSAAEPDAAALASSSAPPLAAPQTEEEKQRLKRERLEAWKKARDAKKGAASPATPATPPTPSTPVQAAAATPEPDRKPVGFAAVKAPNKAPTKGLLFNALAGIGLPNKPTPLKRSITALDDEAAPDRKLQKLENLPDVNPEVQSGSETNLAAVDEDLAVAAGDEDNEDDTVNADVKPELADAPNGETIVGAKDPDMDGSEKNGTKPEAMDVDEEEEEDPLDAFMRQNVVTVKKVNRSDAKRSGLLDDDDDDADGVDVKNKAEEDLAKAEALLALAATKSRKKDLPTPDHAKMDYEPFQKAFYRAPVEVTAMSEEETELVRLEMDGIKIRGQDAPRPVRNWGAFGLPTLCLEQIRANGWEAPTSIQAQAIPAIMSGRDVIGIAKTGSGKTLAFLLPMFRHVKDQRPVSGLDGPIALILSPTRELAMQIHREARPFAKVMNVRVSCCVGGQSISEDIAAMKKGAEIVVCTPGRMIDLLTANNGRVTNLRRITFLVMDEADRMFDMGFEPQVMKIVNNTRPDAQKVLFSATFPKTMESLARRILVRPLEITVGGRSVVAAEIDQRVEIRDHESKFTRLLEILGEMGEANKAEDPDRRALIFVDRQEGADDLFRELLQRGYLAASLHGGREQVDRDDAIKNFKNGDVPILVATSVAARGLDVKELRIVINYDAPNHMEDYVHRAGRTGRAGNKGVCITFITPEQEKFSVDIVRALEASNAYIPDKLKEMAEAFLAKIKSGKARAAASGFSGKGLERIERKREEKDRAEKHTYGDTSEAVSLSSREGAVIPYKAKTNEFKPPERPANHEADYTFTEIQVDIINAPAPDKLPSGPAARGTKADQARLPEQVAGMLERARREGRTHDVANLARILAKLRGSQELTKAEKLGLATAPDAPGRKTKDPDATDWHAVFPINDYPQKARWKATNKEQMTLLQEISGASITMRGVYYPPGEDPSPGQEPKLHLLIESNDEKRVRAAVDELRRNLVEASVAALNTADRAGASGRYAV
ncbi:pre-mRNA processing RNA-helicase [Cryptotrichosporon argae]